VFNGHLSICQVSQSIHSIPLDASFVYSPPHGSVDCGRPRQQVRVASNSAPFSIRFMDALMTLGRTRTCRGLADGMGMNCMPAAPVESATSRACMVRNVYRRVRVGLDPSPNCFVSSMMVHKSHHAAVYVINTMPRLVRIEPDSPEDVHSRSSIGDNTR